jgi:cyclohexa-1,5-dienecarbonyl-CoA hydratase
VSFDPEQTRAAFRLWHPKGNSVTLEMIESLRAALEPLPENSRLKLVTIEGAGDDFSFGAHVAEHTPDRIGRVLPAFHRLIMDLVELPVPTASLVRGRCFGGGFELALATDFIFAAESASFSLPEIALGVFPPAASVLLPWRAGGALAIRTILTGERRDARAWERDGLVTLVTAEADLERDVTAWYASHLGGRSAIALRHAVTAARSGLVSALRAQLPALERLYLGDLMRTADAAEGMAAFLEKRPPAWRDR